MIGRVVHLVERVARVLAARRRARRFVAEVPVAEPPGLLTIGDLGYGGYQLPEDLLGPDSVVLSAGAGTDVTFESLLVDRYGCRVRLLDPVPASAEYVAAALAHEDRIVFERAALWSEDTEIEFHAPEIDGHVSHSATDLHGTPVAFRAPARSLASLAEEHGWDTVDLLKISAEGSEFAILATVLGSPVKVRALCVEFAQPARVPRVQAAIADLAAAGYRPVARSARPFNWKMTFLR